MIKSSSFIKKEYRDILSGVLLFYVIEVAGEFVDSTIAGQFLGEGALEAVEIISSVTFLYGGIALLIAVGFQIMHAHEMGKFDSASASNVFWQAILTCILFGAVTFVISVVFEEPFLRFSGCRGTLFDDARAYYTFFPHIGFVYTLVFILSYLAINDGDSKILLSSSLGYGVSNTLLSILFIKPMGLKGLGLATFLATVLQALLLCGHFFSKNNSIVKIKIRLELKLILDMLQYGFYALLGYASVFVVDIILHNFILTHEKEGYLAAYSIVNLFLDFAVIFDAYSEAGTAVAGVYMGEKNQLGVRKTMHVYLYYILIMGAVYSAVFVGGASIVPELYAIRTPELYEAARMTSLIMGFSGIVMALEYAPMKMYSCLGHPNAGILFTFLFNGVFPLAFGIPLGLKFGYFGLIWGIALSPAATLLAAFLIMILIYGKKGFPYYLGESEYSSFMYCINPKKPKSFDAFSQMAEKLTAEGGLTKRQTDFVRSVSLKMTEKILESNRNSKILIEITVMISNDEIIIISRDNGVRLDLSKNKLLLQSIAAENVPAGSVGEENMSHLVTTSTNRNSFLIKRNLLS